MKTESKRLWHLRKLIQEFEELDRKISAGIESGTIEVIKHVIEKKENIKEFLIEYQNDHLPEQLSNKLRNIRDNCGGYYIDRFNDELQSAFSYELAQKANEEMSERIGGNDWVGKIVGTDLQEYVNEHYHRRKRAIWPFLLKRTLPYNLLNQLNNIRECFSLMQFDVSIVSCIILIELAAFEYLKKKGNISKNIIDLSRYRLAENMNEIRSDVKKL